MVWGGIYTDPSIGGILSPGKIECGNWEDEPAAWRSIRVPSRRA